MSLTVQRESADVVRLDVSGVLRKADLDRVQDAFVAEMRAGRMGPVRLLVVVEAFEGWEPNAAWNDLTFYVRHGDALVRIAIVGDERWRGEWLMFAAADLRKGPVEYFVPEALAEARAWLSL